MYIIPITPIITAAIVIGINACARVVIDEFVQVLLKTKGDYITEFLKSLIVDMLFFV